MKQLIVLAACMALGIAIFVMLAVGPDSIKATMTTVWQNEILNQNSIYP